MKVLCESLSPLPCFALSWFCRPCRGGFAGEPLKHVKACCNLTDRLWESGCLHCYTNHGNHFPGCKAIGGFRIDSRGSNKSKFSATWETQTLSVYISVGSGRFVDLCLFETGSSSTMAEKNCQSFTTLLFPSGKLENGVYLEHRHTWKLQPFLISNISYIVLSALSDVDNFFAILRMFPVPTLMTMATPSLFLAILHVDITCTLEGAGVPTVTTFLLLSSLCTEQRTLHGAIRKIQFLLSPICVGVSINDTM